MLKSLVLSEAEFDEFKQFCREKGFYLSYFSTEVLGSKKEIERHVSDSPKVIKLRKRRFGFYGISFDVAEWQREKWRSTWSQIQDEFFQTRIGEK